MLNRSDKERGPEGVDSEPNNRETQSSATDEAPASSLGQGESVLENWKGDAEERMNKHDQAYGPDPVHTEPSTIRPEDSERCTVRVEQFQEAERGIWT